MNHLTGTLAGINKERAEKELPPISEADMSEDQLMAFQRMHQKADTTDEWNKSWRGQLVNMAQQNNPQSSMDVRNYSAKSKDSGALYPQATDNMGNKVGTRTLTRAKDANFFASIQDRDALDAMNAQIAGSGPGAAQQQTTRNARKSEQQIKAEEARYRAAERRANNLN
jgi:hypothetical protein